MSSSAGGMGGPRDAVAVAEFQVFFDQEMTSIIRFLLYARPWSQLADAENAAQESMTEVFCRWEQIDRPKSYARRTALRRLDAARRADLARQQREREAQERATPAEPEESDRQLPPRVQALRAAMAELPPRQREALAGALADRSPAQTAALAGAKPATVRSNLRHALAALRQQMDQQAGAVVTEEAR
jgi:RNA polymerase sigma-70 factor (ECF subfamily)